MTDLLHVALVTATVGGSLYLLLAAIRDLGR